MTSRDEGSHILEFQGHPGPAEWISHLDWVRACGTRIWGCSLPQAYLCLKQKSQGLLQQGRRHVNLFPGDPASGPAPPAQTQPSYQPPIQQNANLLMWVALDL